MQGLMKFHQGLLKILRKQNVTDERTDGWTDGRTDGWTDGQRENSIPPPPHKHSLRGGNNYPFYIASRTIAHTPLKEADTWFISQRVGQKKLSNLVKVMSQKAGFEEKNNKTLRS